MKSNKGITLIALVITIIVMLILVGVTITLSINGNLFNYAKTARDDTAEARDAEKELSNGKITIEGSSTPVDIMSYATSTNQ